MCRWNVRLIIMAQLPGIGVFGTGTAVKCLIPILKSCGFRVEALWGQTKSLADECARDLDITFRTNNVDEVLLHRDVDLVFIHCPPHLQSPIAVKALGIGKHVICGTPSGPSQLEALRMVRAAQYYPSLMSLMCAGLRFLPCFTRMKQLIDDGYVGDVTVLEARMHSGSLLKDKFNWMCDELMGGGVLNVYGGLMIDLVTFLTCRQAKNVHGLLRTYTQQTDHINGIRAITSDDFCSFQMDLGDDVCATITLNNHVTGSYHQEVLVCGSRGRLVVRGSDLFGQKADANREEILFRDVPNILDEAGTGVSEQIRADIPIPHLKGLLRLIDAVKDAFKSIEEKHGWSREQVAPAATFEDGQYVQAVVDAVRLSSKTAEWVCVQTLSEEPDPNPFLSDALRRSTFSLYWTPLHCSLAIWHPLPLLTPHFPTLWHPHPLLTPASPLPGTLSLYWTPFPHSLAPLLSTTSPDPGTPSLYWPSFPRSLAPPPSTDTPLPARWRFAFLSCETVAGSELTLCIISPTYQLCVARLMLSVAQTMHVIMFAETLSKAPDEHMLKMNTCWNRFIVCI